MLCQVLGPIFLKLIMSSHSATTSSIFHHKQQNISISKRVFRHIQSPCVCLAPVSAALNLIHAFGYFHFPRYVREIGSLRACKHFKALSTSSAKIDPTSHLAQASAGQSSSPLLSVRPPWHRPQRKELGLSIPPLWTYPLLGRLIAINGNLMM